jgi:hypothetical protein
MSLFKFVVDYLADSDRSLVRIAHLAALFRAGEDYLLFIWLLAPGPMGRVFGDA